MGRGSRTLVGLGLVVAAHILLLHPHGGSEALGQDTGPVAAQLEQCRKLRKKSRWAQAVAAYRKLFADHEGSGYVVERIDEIEEDLRQCLFMSAYEKPSAKELFGDGVTSFRAGSRSGKFHFRQPDGPCWIDEGGTLLLNLMFEGTLTIEIGGMPPLSKASAPAILFCYDPSAEGGYMYTPGMPAGGGDSYIPMLLCRMDKGERVELDSLSPVHPVTPSGPRKRKPVPRFTIKIDRRKIKVMVSGTEFMYC